MLIYCDRWPKDHEDRNGSYISREDIAKIFARSEETDADAWIVSNLPIDFPSQEWVTRMASLYGKSACSFLKVKEHLEQNIDPELWGDLSEEELIKLVMPQIIRLHTAKHQLGNVFTDPTEGDWSDPDDYHLAPTIDVENSFLKSKGLFAM